MLYEQQITPRHKQHVRQAVVRANMASVSMLYFMGILMMCHIIHRPMQPIRHADRKYHRAGPLDQVYHFRVCAEIHVSMQGCL